MTEVGSGSLPRGVATRGGRGQGGHGHLNFRTKQGPKVSVSNIRDIAFYGCTEIIWTRNFRIFTVYAINFGQIMVAFANFIGEIDHFTPELLKRADI